MMATRVPSWKERAEAYELALISVRGDLFVWLNQRDIEKLKRSVRENIAYITRVLGDERAWAYRESGVAETERRFAAALAQGQELERQERAEVRREIAREKADRQARERVGGPPREPRPPAVVGPATGPDDPDLPF
jgi:hypothetical protein